MEASRRVWRWASGILAVVCLALIALNFLLPPDDEPVAPSPNSAGGFVAASETNLAEPAAKTAGAAAGHDSSSRADAARLPTGSAQGASQANLDLRVANSRAAGRGRADARSEGQKVAGRAEEKSPGIVPKSHTEQRRQIVEPLGYVETADGQRKAIIGEGQSVQLVAEGQTLADNSRVVRVTSASVEIIPANETKAVVLQTVPRLPEVAQAAASAAPEEPSSELAAEDRPDAGDADSLAAGEESPKGPASVQLANVRSQEPLPHEVEAEASLASVWRISPKGPEPRLVEPGRPPSAEPPVDAALPPSEPPQVAGPPKPLGFVQKADGTTLTVMSDGDSVRLEEQPLTASVTPPSLPAGLLGGMREEVPDAPSWLTSGPSSRGGPGVGIGPVATLKALGYVKQANGRVLAILDAGDSVRLVEEGQVLADGSRVVGITPTSVEVAFQPIKSPDEPSAREQELLAAVTAGSGMLSRWRAPPTEGQSAAPEPDPKARGMPTMGGLAAYSRPPPEHNARDWIEERSRGQPTDKAEEASTTRRSSPASTQREVSRVPSVRGEGGVCLRNGRSGDVDGPSGSPEPYSIRPLGFVEWPGGRVQAIVSTGDSVELLEQGQILTDGSRVVAVSHDAVELSRSFVASSSGHGASPEWVKGAEESLTAARRGEGRPSAEDAVFSTGSSGAGVPALLGLSGGDSGTGLGRVEGNGLQLKWPVRDNRHEPRK
jgi:hypothetical protein